MSAKLDCDVLIVGGGLVGSALAAALGRLPVSVVLVEARDPAALEQPSFDARVTALANGSQRILAGLGLWPALAAEAEPIELIHISERGRLGAARISAAEERVPALGYVVENRVIGAALWDALRAAPRFTWLAPARVTALGTHADGVVAAVARDGETVEVRAKLAVAADGARSAVREALGVAVAEHDYRQRALILNCVTEVAPARRAFERFTPDGPLAFLPLTGGRSGVIWTVPPHEAEALLALPPDAFRDRLQDAFGQRLGRIVRVGERAVHPLARVTAERPRVPRAVLIGNAAVTLHPVAGQGFNLALRDVAALADLLRDEALRRGAHADPGHAALLDRYYAWRSADRVKVTRFTHGLVRLFTARTPGLGLLRGLGLVAFDLAPGAKAALARHTMGRAGRLPRLARGLPLS
ncbi:MAG TPA: 2-octaprenyl-6-methoxyphenyl hydroxylase [Gammaproteobacteria bacterium]